MRKHDPRVPSQDERREHELTHLPFRSWCEHCVKGRGKEEACRKMKEENAGIPEVHLDFMFMGEEKGGKTLAMLVGRERRSRATLSTVVPRKTTGEWTAKRLTAWLREIGLEHSDIIIKSDNEPALVSVVDGLSRARAVVSGSARTVIEHSPVHSSASNGIVERGIQSVQGQVRTMRNAVEAKYGARLEVHHPIWCWLAEYAGHLITRFEVGLDGKTPYERIKGKRARVQGLEFGEGIWWKRRREGGPLGKLTVMWEDGVFLGVKGSTGEVIVGDTKGVWVTRTVRRKPEDQRWSQKNLDMIVEVPWRMNKKVADGDAEEAKMQVTIMDKDYKERLEQEKATEAGPVPRRMYISKGDLEKHGYTVGCPGCVSIIKGTTRQMHSTECRARIEKEMQGSTKRKAAEFRAKEFLGKALERSDEQRRKAKRDKDDQAPGGEPMEEDKPRENDASMDVEKSTASSSGLDGQDNGARSDGMDPMDEQARHEKRGREEEDEEMAEDQGAMKMENAVIGVVNEEEEFEAGDDEQEWDDGDDGKLDPEKVKAGSLEEVEYMVKTLDMFEFGSYEEAKARGGGAEPVTTKWVEGMKLDEKGNAFARCRLVARDFRPRREGPRDDLFAAMPPLEANKAFFALVAGVRGRRRRAGQDEVKLLFIDVRKAHLNARCDEEAWVELPEEFHQWGQYARLRRWLYGMRKAASGWEDDYAKRLESAGFTRGVGAPTVFVNKTTGVRVVVHGDDFTFAGVKHELEKVKALMEGWYEIKMRGIMGSAPEEIKEITILGRTVKWVTGGIEYEADRKHLEELLKETGLTWQSNPLGGPAAKPKPEEAEEEDQDLTGAARTKFRGWRHG